VHQIEQNMISAMAANIQADIDAEILQEIEEMTVIYVKSLDDINVGDLITAIHPHLGKFTGVCVRKEGKAAYLQGPEKTLSIWEDSQADRKSGWAILESETVRKK